MSTSRMRRTPEEILSLLWVPVTLPAGWHFEPWRRSDNCPTLAPHFITDIWAAPRLTKGASFAQAVVTYQESEENTDDYLTLLSRRRVIDMASSVLERVMSNEALTDAP